MQFHLLLTWHLTASFSPATPKVPERSRAAGSKDPRGQNDSKENLKTEMRTEKGGSRRHMQDKRTQINRGHSTELKGGSREQRLRKCRRSSWPRAKSVSKAPVIEQGPGTGKCWAEGKSAGFPVPNKPLGHPLGRPNS